MEPVRSVRPVKVYLEDINRREPIPRRSIHLLPPNFEIKIGRGSQAELFLHPHERNSWFTSRVMSRDHATLRADPETKLVMLQDTGSMHGTYLNGRRVAHNEPVAVLDDEIVQFGAEIVRGEQVYKPLELNVHVDWNDNSPHPPSWLDSQLKTPQTSKNCFSVDYSDEEDDGDVEVVYESIQGQNPTLQRTNSTFSVPESDESNASEVDEDNESAISSPNEEDVPHTSTTKIVVNVPSTSEDCIITSTSVRPGSSVTNALDLDYDDEQPQEMAEDTLEDAELADDFSEDPTPFSDEEDYEPDSFVCEPEPSEAEVEDEDEVAEPVLDDMQDGDFSQTTCKVATETHHRSPSPSDCALPKPSWYLHSSSSGNLPGIQNLVDQVPQHPLLFNEPFSAGLPSNYIHYPPYYPIEHTAHLLPNLDQAYSVQSPNLMYNLTPSTGHYQSFVMTEKIPKTADSLNIESGASGSKHAEKTSKVSINNIIEESQPDQPEANTGSKKRKADEISTHTTADPQVDFEMSPTEIPSPTTANAENQANAPSDISHSLVDVTNPQTTTEPTIGKSTPPKKTVKFSNTAIIIGSDEERPIKKIKTEHKPQTGNFLKYAAATLAGATLGAVGTVLGLAALPADYFV